MTTAGLDRPAPEAFRGLRRPPPGPAGSRSPAALTRLFLTSRLVPIAVVLLAALGAVLWSSLHWHWDIAGGVAARNFIAVTIQSGAAAVITVATYGPFGESER